MNKKSGENPRANTPKRGAGLRRLPDSSGYLSDTKKDVSLAVTFV
tara:strand:+ start:509 stop:643 length:135 start_codon:yes stop_codon:yes gene_type:complete